MASAMAQPAEAAPAPLPNPKSFTEIVALFETRREARLVHTCCTMCTRCGASPA